MSDSTSDDGVELKRNDWMTPDTVWQTLHKEYAFNVDAAADAKNRKCPVYFGPVDGSDPDAPIDDAANGLKRDWFDDDLAARVKHLRAVLSPPVINYDSLAENARLPKHIIRPEDVSVWLNPPYCPKGAVKTWLEKAIAQAGMGVRSVLLIPMATSVAWFNDLVVPYAEWHSFRGRIKFDDPQPTVGKKRESPKQDNLLVILDPNSDRIGHCAVRDSKTGQRIWTRT